MIEIWIKLLWCIHTTGWEQSDCAMNACSSVVICKCSFGREARAKSLLSNRLFSRNWFCWFSQCRNHFFSSKRTKNAETKLWVCVCECISPSHRITTRPSGLFRSEQKTAKTYDCQPLCAGCGNMHVHCDQQYQQHENTSTLCSSTSLSIESHAFYLNIYAIALDITTTTATTAIIIMILYRGAYQRINTWRSAQRSFRLWLWILRCDTVCSAMCKKLSLT